MTKLSPLYPASDVAVAGPRSGRESECVAQSLAPQVSRLLDLAAAVGSMKNFDFNNGMARVPRLPDLAAAVGPMRSS